MGGRTLPVGDGGVKVIVVCCAFGYIFTFVHVKSGGSGLYRWMISMEVL